VSSGKDAVEVLRFYRLLQKQIELWYANNTPCLVNSVLLHSRYVHTTPAKESMNPQHRSTRELAGKVEVNACVDVVFMKRAVLQSQPFPQDLEKRVVANGGWDVSRIYSPFSVALKFTERLPRRPDPIGFPAEHVAMLSVFAALGERLFDVVTKPLAAVSPAHTAPGMSYYIIEGDWSVMDLIRCSDYLNVLANNNSANLLYVSKCPEQGKPGDIMLVIPQPRSTKRPVSERDDVDDNHPVKKSKEIS
jgi:hypothetical protein